MAAQKLARALEADMDIVLAHKLSSPGHTEVKNSLNSNISELPKCP